MGEISEVERARRRLEKKNKPQNETAAQSFRLGSKHVDRLRQLADRSAVSQADLIRKMIDREWKRVETLRKRRAEAHN